MIDRLPDVVLDFQLETRPSSNRRYVTHIVHDHDQPPSTPPRVEKWKSGRQPIGNGAQGQVFLQDCIAGARHCKVRAVKVVPGGRGSQRRLFARELETMARFSHQKYAKYFVRMLGWYYCNVGLSIAMEYLPEGDLHTYMMDNPPFTEAEAQQIMSQVVQGVEMMHSGGYSHRDIKPQNVLIQQRPTEESSSTWWVKLADFGISKRMDSTMSTVRGPIGTLEFMSPELLEHADEESEIDYQAADTWAVGVMTFFILTKLRGFRRRRNDFERNQFLSSTHDISSEGLDFILKLTCYHASERPGLAEVTSYAWVDHYIPKLSVTGAADDDASSSGRSSLDSWLSTEQEMTTLTTQITNTLLGPTSNVGIQSTTTQEETVVVKPTLVPVQIIATPVGGEPNVPVSTASQPRTETAKPHITTGKDSQALMEAARSGNYNETRRLLDNGADFAARNLNGETPLLLACRYGHESTVRLLLDRGAMIEVSTKNGDTALHLASMSGHVPTVRLVLAREAEVHSTNKDNQTALIAACRVGQEATALQLLDHGADLHASDRWGKTALHWACGGGHELTARILLRHGADFNAAMQARNTPLMLACAIGHEPIVKLLLESGADINISSHFSETAMRAASRCGHDSIVQLLRAHEVLKKQTRTSSGETDPAGEMTAPLKAQLLSRRAITAENQEKDPFHLHQAVWAGYDWHVRQLLHRGADVRAPGDYGQTTLYLACLGGRASTVRLVLDGGADIDAATDSGVTPLHYTSGNGDMTTVQLLLDRGASIHATNSRGRTALHYACLKGRRAIVRLLLKRGANVHAEDHQGATALHVASRHDQGSLVRTLLNGGADIDARDEDGSTALHDACRYYSSSAAQELLDSKANVSSRNHFGESALHIASEKGIPLHFPLGKRQIPLAQLLLERGADIHATDEDGRTPLFCAALARRGSIVQTLLDAGADVNHADRGGRTALHEALDRGWNEIVRLMLGRGANTGLLADGRIKKYLEAAIKATLRDQETAVPVHGNHRWRG